MGYLCVNQKDLNSSPDMQKKIHLDKIFSKSKYYDCEEEAKKDGYYPLCFATSVRSVNTNLVVRLKESGDDCNNRDSVIIPSCCYSYYQSQVSVPSFSYVGEDLVSYQSSINVMRYFRSSLSLSECMMRYTTHQIIGLYNPGVDICLPTILSHVIIQDIAVKTFQAYFRDGVEWYPIEDISPSLGDIQTFLDQLIIIKGGKPYER